MKIKIYSDVICPFCYIGKTRLDNVLASMGITQNIEYEWKAFLLNPNGSSEADKKLPYKEYLRIHKQSSVDRINQATDYIVVAGKAEGLDINYSKMIPAGTIDAHRLSKMAHSIGKEDEAQQILMKAFFTEGKDLEKTETLIEAGLKIGLDEEKIKEMLSGNDYLHEVIADFREAQHMAIQGVPHFIINEKYTIHGAQPQEEFVTLINRIVKDETEQNTTQNNNGLVCEDEFCEIPDK